MNSSDIDNHIHNLDDENGCQILCFFLLGIFGIVILLYGIFWYREVSNKSDIDSDTELTDDLIRSECLHVI